MQGVPSRRRVAHWFLGDRSPAASTTLCDRRTVSLPLMLQRCVLDHDAVTATSADPCHPCHSHLPEMSVAEQRHLGLTDHRVPQESFPPSSAAEHVNHAVGGVVADPSRSSKRTLSIAGQRGNAGKVAQQRWIVGMLRRHLRTLEVTVAERNGYQST